MKLGWDYIASDSSAVIQIDHRCLDHEVYLFPHMMYLSHSSCTLIIYVYSHVHAEQSFDYYQEHDIEMAFTKAHEY